MAFHTKELAELKQEETTLQAQLNSLFKDPNAPSLGYKDSVTTDLKKHAKDLRRRLRWNQEAQTMLMGGLLAAQAQSASSGAFDVIKDPELCTFLKYDQRQNVVDAVKKHWKHIQSDDVRCRPLLIFYGESGSGKSVSATQDTKAAVKSVLNRDNVSVVRIRLTCTVVEQDSGPTRDTKTMQLVQPLLAGYKPDDWVILVVDECSSDPHFCRALSGLYNERTHAFGCHLLLVFAGVVTGTKSLLPTALFAIEKVPTEMISLEPDPDLNRSMFCKYVKCDHVPLWCEEILRRVGGNLAALRFVVESVVNTRKDVNVIDPSEIEEQAMQKLMKRNGIGAMRLTDMVALLKEARKLAVLRCVHATEHETAVTEASQRGLITSTTTAGGTTHISMSGFYWLFSCQQIQEDHHQFVFRPSNSFQLTPSEFEEMIAKAIGERIYELSKLKKCSKCRIEELLPHCLMADGIDPSAEVSLPHHDVIHLVRSAQKLELGEHQRKCVRDANNKTWNIELGMVIVNGGDLMATSFGNIIVLLPGLVLVIQTKYWTSTNATADAECTIGWGQDGILGEYCKAGFTDAVNDQKGDDDDDDDVSSPLWENQQSLLDELRQLCATNTNRPAKAVFLLITNKRLTHKKEEEWQLHTNKMPCAALIHAENFKSALMPFCYSANYLLPESPSPAKKTRKREREE